MKKLLFALLIGLSLLTALHPAVAANPTIDPRAVALLKQEAKAVQAVHSLTGNFTELLQFAHKNLPNSEMRMDVAFKWMRPNYQYEVVSNANKPPKTGQWSKDSRAMTIMSDGKSVITLEADDSYQKTPATGRFVNAGFVFPLADFFDAKEAVYHQVNTRRKASRLPGLSYLGMKSWDGAQYQVIEWQYKSVYLSKADAGTAPGGVFMTELLYIGADGLVHRILQTNNVGWHIDNYLSNVQVNPSLTKASFAIALPQDAHLPKPPPPLLANGTQAPNFTVQNQAGKPISLSDYRGKVVVLDFWATWCGPCQMSLPHTNAVAQQFQNQNVVVLAVNVWDSQKAFDAWLPQHKQYNAIHFAIDPRPQGKDVATSLYQVSGIPTQYIIAPNGSIVQSFVGYGGPNNDLANAIKKAESISASAPMGAAGVGK